MIQTLQMKAQDAALLQLQNKGQILMIHIGQLGWK